MIKEIFSINLLIISLTFIFSSLPAFSTENNKLIQDIYEKAIALSPDILNPHSPMAHPYVTSGKQTIYLNTAFWDLVRGWIQLYEKEIQQYCSCEINEEELIRKVQDHIPQSLLYSKFLNPVKHHIKHGVVTTAGLGSKYGKTALILKASAEIAETAVSIFSGFKGIHIICQPIDFIIFFIIRKTQIYTRVFKNSKSLGENRLLMSLRLAWIRRQMKKAQNKVFFHLESVTIDPEGLKKINDKELQNKRSHWVKNLSQQIIPILKDIESLESLLENKELSPRQRIRIISKRAKLYKKIDHLTGVSKKDFFGNRYKRFLFILSRKGKATYLKGNAFPDKITSNDWLWALSIQENILEKAFLQKTEHIITKNIFPLESSPLKENEIRKGLAEEFVEKFNKQGLNLKEHTLSVEYVLEDIEKIFNPSLSMKERYFLTSVIEVGLTGFLNYYLNLIYKKLETNLSLRKKIQLRWKLDQSTYYSYIYTDFLITASLTKNTTQLISYKYEAMENLLAVLEYLNRLSELSSETESMKILAQLDQYLHKVKALQVAKPKTTAFSWIPFKSSVFPQCRELIRKIK